MKYILILLLFVSCKKEELINPNNIDIKIKSSVYNYGKTITIKIDSNLVYYDFLIGSHNIKYEAYNKSYIIEVLYQSTKDLNDTLKVKGLNTDTAFLLEKNKTYKFVIK